MHSINVANIPPGYAINSAGIIVPESCVQLMAGLEVFGPDGSLKAKIEQPSRSLVRWFSRMIEAALRQSVTFDCNNTAGVVQTFPWKHATSLGNVAATPAIQIGTGTVAAASTDVKISTAYAVSDLAIIINTTETASQAQFICTATGTATSTATLTEIALIASLQNTAAGQQYVCWARDVFSPGISVVNGDGFTAKYTFTFNV